ncbi:C-X-C motif chemokine 11-1-like [Engraulis encrasicolus]|uniref:C-X-C motif chemokine 11-1-like n=1 Tax=Engraulis encrasicolus TaxID=184585 RepID=UPI002FD05B9E
MKSAVLLALLAVLLFGLVKGQRISRRCRCQGPLRNAVRPNRIQKVEAIPASPSCPNLEIIVKLEDGSKACLNPQSNFTKRYMESLLKAQAKAKETTTEADASSEFTTSSPESPTITMETAATDNFTSSRADASSEFTNSSPESPTITIETTATDDFTTRR